jgi:hypothetical protein
MQGNEKQTGPITRLEITSPVLINKAIITPAILQEIEEMQAYCKAGWDKPVYDNEGVQLHVKSIDEAISFFVSEIADSSIGVVKHKEIRIMCDLNYVRQSVLRLAIDKDIVNGFGFEAIV